MLSPFLAAISSEWTKLWSVRSTWWCVIGAAALMALYSVPLGFDAAEPNLELSHADQLLHVEEVATAGMLFTQFALIALALLTVTSEYASGSMRTTLQCEPRRGRVLVAKLLVVEVVALVAGALLALLGAGLGYLTAGDYGVFDVSAVAEVAGRMSVYMGAVVALAIGLAVALRSTAGALVVAFLALFLLPMVLMMSGMDLMTEVSYYLPGTAGTEYLGVGIATIFGLDEGLPYDGNGGLGLLAGWSVVTLLAGYVVFRRRDA